MLRVLPPVLSSIVLTTVLGGTQGPPAAPEPRWTAAVVIQVTDGQRKLVGTAPGPVVHSLPAPTDEAAKTEVDVSHEVWLVADGMTAGLWYSRQTREVGACTSIGRYSPGRRDSGEILSLIQRAVPPAVAAPFSAQARENVTRFGAIESLDKLCRLSDVIVVGRTAGRLRRAHTPVNSEGPSQHTVTTLAVDRYLKGAVSRPGVLKIYQSGGSLPFQALEGRVRGVGLASEGDPLLEPGKRCLLFLRKPDDSPTSRRLGYLSGTVDGVTGKVGELDELRLTDPGRGRYVIEAGILRSQSGTGTPSELRLTGNQLVGLREEEAVERIEKLVSPRLKQPSAVSPS